MHEREPDFWPFVIRTMNVADRSLASVDFAVRWRFAVLTLEPRFGDVSFRRWLTDRKLPETVLQLESRLGRCLLVVFTELDSSGTLRIVSARPATKRERKAYEED